MEYEILHLKHELKLVPLRENLAKLEKPFKDREDHSLRVIKENRDQLQGYFEHVLAFHYRKYPLIDKLKPLHEGFEVDGVYIQLPDYHQDYHKYHLRL